MHKSLWVAAIALVFACRLAWADESTRAAQEALTREGFYFGAVDGNPGAETTAALRRFQIRNGLEVTGELDDATRRALLPAPETPPAPAPPPSATPVPAPSAAPARQPAPPRDPSAPSPSSPAQQSPRPDVAAEREAAASSLSALFRGTVYATAPAYVRIDVLRSAQLHLRREGLYSGDIDGIPGLGTTRGLVDYQRRWALVQTGRLDMDTLARMGLLPRVLPGPPPPGRMPRMVPPPRYPPPAGPPPGW